MLGEPAAGLAAVLVVVQFVASARAQLIRGITYSKFSPSTSAQSPKAGFATAPAGMMLQTPELIRQHAAKVYQRAVQTKDMPLANMTHMTDEERALIGAWFEAGAK